LACVGSTDDRQPRSMATEPASFYSRQQLVDGGGSPSQWLAEPGGFDALLGVVESSLDRGVGTGQVGLDGSETLAQRSAQAQRCVAPGCVGGGVDEVEHCFGLCQVDAAVEVGAQRELARPSRTRTC